MLSYLAVTNLALFDRVELELQPGLTVVTGETGAGKSMLLNALLLLLGGKAEREAVRSGESELTVEAAWKATGDSLHPSRLPGLESDDEGEGGPDEVIIRRTMRITEGQKRDRLFVADRLCTLARMQEVAADMVNISSQHEYIRLLRRSEHLDILDRFAMHEGLLAKMRARFDTFRDLEARVAKTREEASRRDESQARLSAQCAELQGANLESGEEETLLADIARLTHAGDIGQALEHGLAGLYEDDDAVASRLSGIERRLSAALRFEPALATIVERINACAAEVSDVAETLRALLQRVEADPALLDHFQERLSRLQKLKRRFEASTVDDLIRRLAESRDELRRIEGLSDSLSDLETALEKTRTEMLEASDALHKSRVKAAAKLEKAIAKTLSMLEMQRASFRIPVEPCPEEISAVGADRVEFLFSANRGEDPRPLQKIASGGELSRVLLAFKAVLADAYPVPTYVFDEIDAGIGGKTALAVGKLLSQLGRAHQVLCVTHTAQLAAFADHHLVVSKSEKGGRTKALVTPLADSDERVAELARMLSGLDDSASALSHARELLDSAQKEKV